MNQTDEDRLYKVGLALDAVIRGFRALEFIGQHTNAVKSNDSVCAQCARATMDSYLGLISVEEASLLLCSELTQAINQYKTALLIVNQWEESAQAAWD